MLDFKEKLTRTVGEIRYRPTLASTRGAIDFGKILEKKFPHWRIENNQNLVLFNDEKKIRIRIKHNAISFLNDGDLSNEDFLLQMHEELFNEMKKGSGIADFLHVGSRKRYVYETNLQPKDLVDLTFKKFYGNISDLRKISGEKILDTSFVLDAQRDNFNTHVQIGPTDASGAADFFETDIENLDKTKTYVLFDIDAYKNNSITAENASASLREVVSGCTEVKDLYLQFLIS